MTYLMTATSTTSDVNNAKWFRTHTDAERFAAESPYRTRVVRISVGGFVGHAVAVEDRNLTADIMRDATPPSPRSF